MTLQDWANLATALGAISTFIVGMSALVVSIAALRTQRESLPVSAEFMLAPQRLLIDDDGVRWIWASLKNTGVRAYVHDIYPIDWKPKVPIGKRTPNSVRLGVPDSLPDNLKSVSKRKLRRNLGVFVPSYVGSQAYLSFWISCPPEFEKIQFVAAVSVRRRDKIRFIDSEWLDVPIPDETARAVSNKTFLSFDTFVRPEDFMDPAESEEYEYWEYGYWKDEYEGSEPEENDFWGYGYWQDDCEDPESRENEFENHDCWEYGCWEYELEKFQSEEYEYWEYGYWQDEYDENSY
jgi:hypothetical protein